MPLMPALRAEAGLIYISNYRPARVRPRLKKKKERKNNMEKKRKKPHPHAIINSIE